MLEGPPVRRYSDLAGPVRVFFLAHQVFDEREAASWEFTFEWTLMLRHDVFCCPTLDP